MIDPARRVLLAGTAGGVGVTTVTALLFSTLRETPSGAAPLLDHTAGDLGARLPDGDQVDRLSDRLLLHDLGRHALGAGVAGLSDPASLLVVVSAATPVGCALAGHVTETVRRVHGPPGSARMVLVLVGAFGRHRISRQLRELAVAPAGGLVVLPPDAALAAGGAIPLTRVSRSTTRAVAALSELVDPAARTRPGAPRT